MIFVTVGTQKFQMDRLIRKIDDMAENFPKETFFAQIGNCDYIPKHIQYERFVSRDKFDDLIEMSQLIISHAGVGSIMSGIRMGKKVIVVPRCKKYGEHVDNHQIEIAEAFKIKNCAIYCEELGRLEYIIRNEQSYQLSPYMAPDGNIQNIILDYITGNKPEEKSER